METYGLSYFLGKFFFDEDGSQSMFVYQPILSMLQLKTNKGCFCQNIWKDKTCKIDL